MSRRDPTVRLRHMLDYAREVIAMGAGKTATELGENRQLKIRVE